MAYKVVVTFEAEGYAEDGETKIYGTATGCGYDETNWKEAYRKAYSSARSEFSEITKYISKPSFTIMKV